MDIKITSVFGQLYPPSFPLEQVDAQIPFQGQDGSAETGLGDVKFLGRLCIIQPVCGNSTAAKDSFTKYLLIEAPAGLLPRASSRGAKTLLSVSCSFKARAMAERRHTVGHGRAVIAFYRPFLLQTGNLFGAVSIFLHHLPRWAWTGRGPDHLRFLGG